MVNNPAPAIRPVEKDCAGPLEGLLPHKCVGQGHRFVNTVTVRSVFHKCQMMSMVGKLQKQVCQNLEPSDVRRRTYPGPRNRDGHV